MALNPRNIKCYFELESTPGTAVFPADATNGFFATDFPVANQTVNYTESPEIKTSLNISDQTKNRQEGGTFSVSMAIRPNTYSANVAQEPQGAHLLESLQGARYTLSGAALNADINDSVTSLVLKTVADIPPSVGVILIDSELILYTGMSYVASGDTWTVTLNGCTRGYNGTTAASHLTDASATSSDRAYIQRIDKPTYTLWFMYDNGLMKRCSGSAITDLSFSVTNAGYPTFDMQGSCFTIKEFAAVTAVSVASQVLTVTTGQGTRLEAGLKIYNHTTTPSPETSDILVITDVTGDDVTVTGTLAASNGDEFRLWLPDISTINETVESLKTKIYMKELTDGIDSTVRRYPTTYGATVSAPMYLYTDEITEDDPDDYTFERRTITGNFTEVAKASNIDLFTTADAGDEKTIVFMLGNGTPGDTCYVIMPRCTIQIPTMEISEPLITRSVEFTALNTEVEDSFQIVFA